LAQHRLNQSDRRRKFWRLKVIQVLTLKATALVSEPKMAASAEWWPGLKPEISSFSASRQAVTVCSVRPGRRLCRLRQV
jgi:hypothetical protein